MSVDVQPCSWRWVKLFPNLSSTMVDQPTRLSSKRQLRSTELSMKHQLTTTWHEVQLKIVFKMRSMNECKHMGGTFFYLTSLDHHIQGEKG